MSLNNEYGPESEKSVVELKKFFIRIKTVFDLTRLMDFYGFSKPIMSHVNEAYNLAADLAYREAKQSPLITKLYREAESLMTVSMIPPTDQWDKERDHRWANFRGQRDFDWEIRVMNLLDQLMMLTEEMEAVSHHQPVAEIQAAIDLFGAWRKKNRQLEKVLAKAGMIGR